MIGIMILGEKIIWPVIVNEIEYKTSLSTANLSVTGRLIKFEFSKLGFLSF